MFRWLKIGVLITKRLKRIAEKLSEEKLQSRAETYCDINDISKGTIRVYNDDVVLGDERRNCYEVAVEVANWQISKITLSIIGEISESATDPGVFESFLNCPMEGSRILDEWIDDTLERLERDRDNK